MTTDPRRTAAHRQKSQPRRSSCAHSVVVTQRISRDSEQIPVRPSSAGGASTWMAAATAATATAVPAWFDMWPPSLAEMAAAYLFQLVRNHPFVDGNKRAGL